MGCVRFVIAAVSLCFASTTQQLLADEPIDFSVDVAPIFAEHCSDCHGADESNGGISFEHKQTLFEMADSGQPAVRPGEPGESELIKRVLSTDEADRMPPDGERLSEATVSKLRRWIEEGASWPQDQPSDLPTKVTTDHWSFQPIADPEPPAADDAHWQRNSIDAFIQARRESAGLQVAPDADAVTLIRRVSYGLTGLPPSPEEVAQFVSQCDSPGGVDAAMEALVDRLLNSPQYGERWGRHWMDWVRYADTAGDNSDFPIPQAYLYRNYIIDSFNQDLPYDQFLTEQLAGDVLPADSLEQRNRQTIATGYLAMARRFGSLVETYPWHLTIEDTIDNVGRTMMGLTLACARCHDHKFDPISTRDYYGLYGIFESTQYPFPGIELFQTQMDFVPLVSEQDVSATMKPHQRKTAELKSELERLLAECEQRALENAAKASSATLAEQRKQGDQLDALLLKARKAGEKLAEHLKALPAIPTAYAVQDSEPTDARIHIKGEPERLGATVPRRFPQVLGGYTVPDSVADDESGRLQLAQWIASPDNPLTARVIVNRVWQRHFGQGLVPSLSDFGLRGESPTHPELLDWLATQFIRSGWSIKSLHRLIMQSRTYRLASRDLPENLATDPDNHFYWKFNRQRLDAEAIRDSLLAISGSLDLSTPGEPHPFPPLKEWKFTQHHPFKDSYASNRRSVYLMTKRLTAQSYFQTFDGPDPNACTSERDQSVTTLQALYFLNNDFLHEQATRTAAEVIQHSTTYQERLSRAFSLILCRQPTLDEVDILSEHIAAASQQLAGDPEAETKVWSSLCRSLMRLNEFLYID